VKGEVSSSQGQQPASPDSSQSKQADAKNRAQAVQAAKDRLRYEIAGTFRGGAASSSQRAAIAEAQLEVEAYGTQPDIESLLPGRWLLIYTTALDVLPLVAAPSIPFPQPVQIGSIYQQFSTVGAGEVQNIIKVTLPFLTQEEGVTLRVKAGYTVTSPRRIALRFKSAGVSDVDISDLTETFIAPALLGRSWLSHRILLALKELNLQVPIPSISNMQGGAAVGEYLFTYMDEEMLIGRAEGGTYIFLRDTESHQP
jgi:hypothetical protein